MKKIPTLFKREFVNHKVCNIFPEVTEGFEWVLNGEGVATIKWDGSCCAIINGEFYKRYDAKKGKAAPPGAIPCCDPDPVTGHFPHWVKCDRNAPNDRWFWAAYDFYVQRAGTVPKDGTYEAIGEHFNGNPYNQKGDKLVRHGINVVTVERSFEGIKQYLEENDIEGLVFWKDGCPQCKIKRSDFALTWGANGMAKKGGAAG